MPSVDNIVQLQSMRKGHRTRREMRACAATAYPHATDAAVEILAAGGNAVDAAVAAAWALSVCEPSGSGLGGQTTMLIHTSDGRDVVVDGHSRAPARASLARIDERGQSIGYRACTVPSTPATLGHVQRRFGALSHTRVMEPAIRLAEHGYPLSRLQRRQIGWCADELHACRSDQIFRRGRRLLRAGETLVQPALAATLRRLADAGCEDFYRGRLARAIARDMKRNGGLITRADLDECTLPVEREPVAMDYGSHRVLSVPPPGGGVQLLQALKVFEQLLPHGSKDSDIRYETIANVVYAIFAFRERWPVHSADFTPSMCRWLLSDELAGEIADSVRRDCVHPAIESGAEPPGDTTHLNVADDDGNVVALTQSVQSLFGSKVAHPKLGFFYNNYLTTCVRYPHPAQLGGGCTPRSNVAPVMVFERTAGVGGKGGAAASPVMAMGAAGSRRITSSLLRVLTGMLDEGLSAEQAVSAPRIHALLNGNVWAEDSALSESLQARLGRTFRRVKRKRALSYAMGNVQVIGARGAAADPRRDGSATVIGAESPAAGGGDSTGDR